MQHRLIIISIMTRLQVRVWRCIFSECTFSVHINNQSSKQTAIRCYDRMQPSECCKCYREPFESVYRRTHIIPWLSRRDSIL